MFDALRDRMIVFGGDEIYGPIHNDIWSLGFATFPEWTEIVPNGTPPSARTGHSLILDPAEDRLLIFGGSDVGWGSGAPHALDEVWQLSLSAVPVWSRVTPSGAPPKARLGHTAVYDPVGPRMIVFGGNNGGQRLNDTWALTLGGSPAWVELTPQGIPPNARDGHVAVYDPVGHRMIVFGGFSSVGTVSETWSLSLGPTPGWTRLNLTSSVPGRPWQHSAAFDPTGNRMLVYGGYGASGLWALPLTGTTGVEPALPPRGIALAPPRPNPATGPIVASFTLPDASPARLELFDLAGRRVASREVGSLGAGAHRVTLAGAGELRPGVYVIRLSHGADQISVRVAVVR